MAIKLNPDGSVKPRKLPEKYIGVERCVTYGDRGAKICATGAKFGWQVWAMSPTGEKVFPISVGDARTPGQALRVARQSLQSTNRGVPMRARARSRRIDAARRSRR